MTIAQPVIFDKNSYLSRYLKGFTHDNLDDELKDVFQSTMSLFKNISEEKAKYRYEEGKWSVKQLLRHITDCERIFGYRTLCISREENCVLPGFDENIYAANDNSDNLPLKIILEEYETVRKSTQLIFATIDPAVLDNTGITSGGEVTPRILGWVNAGHNIHHLNILRERYNIG